MFDEHFAQLPEISPERKARWGDIAAITQKMLGEAKAERWVEVAELDKQRRRLLEAFFTPAVMPDEAAAVAERIKWVLDVDKEILAIGKSARTELRQKMGGMAQRRRVNTAYTDNM